MINRTSWNNKLKSENLLSLWLGLSCLLLLSLPASAQKQANIWHFGDGRCLDFSSGSPVIVPGSAMNTYEGCASWCDAYGNLLMYTNGGGREPAFSGQDAGHIWNQNNAVMYNMQGVEGGGFSSVQSAVIFEAPGQDSVYYVFTMDEVEYYVGASPATQAAQPVGRGLSYFTVDMRLNGGLGGVVLADQRVYTPSYEGLCAIRHANGRDYWVIINRDSTGLGVYSVTPAGVAFAGAYSAAGGSGSTAGGSASTIKASPNGAQVAVTLSGPSGAGGSTYVLAFDDNTGQFSNPVPLAIPDFISYYEFSPNSRFLYTTQVNLSSFPPVESIVRYDLQAPSITASATMLGNITNGNSIGLQLAPDGKIYFLAVDYATSTHYINRIKCPNTTGSSLELNVFTTVSPSGAFYLGLPNFPAWLFENDDSTPVSLGPDTVDLCDVGGSYLLNAQNPGATFLWSTGATTQTITVNSPGIYSVTVTGDCGTGTDQVVVVNCNNPTNPISCDTAGNWLFFGNYDGGKLNIIIDENIPNLKIGICTYEPVVVTFSGPFVGNITDVYYAGLNSSAGNNNCGFPITTSSFVGVNPSLVTVDVAPPVNIISPPNPANILNLPNGYNFGVICVYSCDLSTYQGGCNTLDQVLDVFQTRFGGSLRGLTVQYCCWSDSLPYRVSSVSGKCCDNAPGTASISYPQGPFCSGAGQLVPTLLGDSSGTFYTVPSGLNIDPATGVIDLAGSTAGTYVVVYAISVNCISNLYKDTIVISGGSSSGSSLTVTACSSYTAPNGTVLTSSGLYSITIPNSIGCDSIISITLTITGAITNPPAQVSACSSYTAPWGTVYTQSGSYTDTLTTVNGCDSIITVNLNITGSVTSPPVNVNACDSYTAPWGTVYTQSGTYSDTLTTVNGCDSIVSINLSLSAAVLSSQTASACSSYVSPIGTVYTQSGIYSDTLSTAAGCDSIITTTLTITGVPTLSATASPDTCDQNTGTITATATGAGGTYVFLWSNGDSGNNINNLGNGLYTVTVTDQNGCSSSTQIAVASIPGPAVTASASSFIILEGDSVQLTGTGATNYQWSPPNGLSCTTCENPVASPAQTTTYTVTGTDNNGCTGTASVTLSVDIRCNELFLPDIFSPDGTGPQANEKVCAFGNCISEMLFAVYNRWGQRVFETNDPLSCWDGTFKGKECLPGVYAYRLTVTQLDGKTITRSGNITLVR